MVGVFERVYEVGPVFRAEPHDTVRHLAQYTSLDAELGFIGDHRDVMAVVREVMAAMLDGTGVAVRPFYTHPEPGRPSFSNGFDLLFRGLEIVTGGQRLHRYGDYLAALAGQDLAPYEAYLQAFRHGMPPHGGFALGLERSVARLVGTANVRQTTLFPRDLHRLSP